VDLNLHLVRYLLAVADEGHFGRAAQRLYISPPSLSQQIRKLEQQVGAVLLDRSAHPVRPTEAGARFLREARTAVDAADRAVSAVATYLREQASTVRIGFISGAAGPFTRPVLDELAEAAPHVVVQMVQLGWAEQGSAVRDGTVDAAFVRPPIADLSGLCLDLVFDEPRVVALTTAHRLAGRVEVGIDDLDGEVQVTDDEVEDAWLRWWSVDPRPSGAPVRYGPVVHTMDEMLHVVAAGQAIAITASSVAETNRRSDIAFVPIRDVDPCPVSLCTRAGATGGPVAALRTAVRSVLARTDQARVPR
jgi:DNA-binding transcriptional LysR family regulator